MEEKYLIATSYSGSWWSELQIGRIILIPASNIAYLEDGHYMGAFSDEQKNGIEDHRIRDIALKNEYLGTHIVLKKDVTDKPKDFYVLESISQCLSQLTS